MPLGPSLSLEESWKSLISSHHVETNNSIIFTEENLKLSLSPSSSWGKGGVSETAPKIPGENARHEGHTPQRGPWPWCSPEWHPSTATCAGGYCGIPLRADALQGGAVNHPQQWDHRAIACSKLQPPPRKLSTKAEATTANRSNPGMCLRSWLPFASHFDP